ncbi:MAG: nitroreductase [Deltaproteobacteria bacterium]|jgi:nitroreductase|nr:nitroreductase [Deltaproteobacteria bacterium]MBW2483293.1 nitroreductase [Deltaproteobacteria bacterium]
MELQEAVRSRRSIRQFLSKPVSEDIIRELIADSLWSPSWGNTQPWEIVVVTGSKMAEFKQKSQEALMSGHQVPTDIPMPQVWPEAYLDRYKELGKSVLGALSIAREDKEARMQHFVKMFGFFDAPAAVLVAVDKTLALEYAMLDAGIFLQTFCLLAHDRGLGTCIMAAMVTYPDIARELFGVPADKLFVMGAALGWPDPDAPVNCFERQRGSMDDFVTWVE